jgi:GNAT superfamily N-acetyltransferase
MTRDRSRQYQDRAAGTVGHTMDVTIRAAEPADLTELEILRAQALKATFQSEHDRRTVADLVATVDDELAAWIDDESYRVLVAETEITPVCYAALDREEGEVLTVVTSPDYTREGFASEVLARIEEDASDHGHEMLSASAPQPVAPFFESNGFEEEGSAQWYGLAAIRYHKQV